MMWFGSLAWTQRADSNELKALKMNDFRTSYGGKKNFVIVLDSRFFIFEKFSITSEIIIRPLSIGEYSSSPKKIYLSFKLLKNHSPSPLERSCHFEFIRNVIKL